MSVVEESDWWMQLGTLLGWRLFFWIHRDMAIFVDGRGYQIHLTSAQRGDIMAAIASAQYHAYCNARGQEVKP